MIAVIFDSEGAIFQSVEGSQETIEATARALDMQYLEVAERRDDYDRAFRVVGDHLASKD